MFKRKTVSICRGRQRGRYFVIHKRKESDRVPCFGEYLLRTYYRPGRDTRWLRVPALWSLLLSVVGDSRREGVTAWVFQRVLEPTLHHVQALSSIKKK